jgi:hypothetical protein
METIKLTGNKFPVAESLHAKQAEHVEAEKQAEQSAGTEPNDIEPLPDYPLKALEESEEEKNEKRTLIRKIMRYRSTFPTELIDLSQKLNNLGCYSLYELRDLCRDVEYLVATRRSSKAMRSFFLAGLGVLEVSGGIVGLQLNGLTHIASQNEELLTTVDEAAIKHEKLLELPPLQRLAIGVAQLAFVVDAKNRMVQNDQPDRPIIQPVQTAQPDRPTQPDRPAQPSLKAVDEVPNNVRCEFDDL